MFDINTYSEKSPEELCDLLKKNERFRTSLLKFDLVMSKLMSAGFTIEVQENGEHDWHFQVPLSVILPAHEQEDETLDNVIPFRGAA